MRSKLIIWFIAAGVFLHTGCGFYSHSGASIPASAKTFSVSYLNNLASIVMPTFSQILTERLKSKFINETPLKLTQSEGDIRFSGKILSYATAPVAVQGNQQNAVNRLTVTIEITYENIKEEGKNFTQQFTNYVDYSASDNFAGVEQDLVNKVTDILVQDVFNKAFINW